MLIIKIPECDFHFELHCWALLWRWLLTFPVQTVFLLPDTKTQHKCCKYDKSSVSRTLLSLYIHKFIYLYTNIYISYVLFISDVTFTHLSPETFNFKHWKYVYIFCSSVPVNPPPLASEGATGVPRVMKILYIHIFLEHDWDLTVAPVMLSFVVFV